MYRPSTFAYRHGRDPNLDVNVEQRDAGRRCRLPLVGAARPLHQAGAGEYRDRVPHVEQIDGRPTWVFDGHPLGVHGAAARDRPRRAQGELAHGAARVDDRGGPRRRRGTRRPGSRCSTSAASTHRSSSRARSASAARISAWSRTTRSAVPTIEIYNDRMAEIQADSDNRLLPMPLMPAWNVDACVAEAKRVGGARHARREHDVRPAGPRCARPRQPRVGPVLGGLQRPRAAGALPHRRQRHRR